MDRIEAMSGTDHKHPTFGVCLCGHLDFAHPWTTGERVDYQGHCTAAVPDGHEWNDGKGRDIIVYRTCECRAFHADPLTLKEER